MKIKNIYDIAGRAMAAQMVRLNTISSNLAGLPAISIPHGQVNSLPVGLQLIGNFLREDQLINAAHIFQKNSDFHYAKPSMEDFK